MEASTFNNMNMNQVPLVNSTQLIQSTQAPVISQAPVTSVAASTPIVNNVSQVPIVSSIPQQVQTVIPTQHYTTQTTLNTLVDEDYRLGRGILDDFRPNAYKAQVGLVGNTTTNIITSSTLPIANVSTPVTSAINTNGANVLKEFL